MLILTGCLKKFTWRVIRLALLRVAVLGAADLDEWARKAAMTETFVLEEMEAYAREEGITIHDHVAKLNWDLRMSQHEGDIEGFVEVGRFALSRVETFRYELFGYWRTNDTRLVAVQALLGRALTYSPNHATAHALLGLCRGFWPITRANFFQALDHLEKARRAEPQGQFLAEALLGEAFLRIHRGPTEDPFAWQSAPEDQAMISAELLRQAAALGRARGSPDADAHLGLALLAQRLDGAGAIATAAADDFSCEESDCHMMHEPVLRHLRQAHALRPDSRAIASLYGEMLSTMGHVPEAIQVWKGEAQPGAPQVHRASLWRSPWQRPLDIFWPDLEPEGWDGVTASQFDAFPELRRARRFLSANWLELRDELLPLLHLGHDHVSHPGGLAIADSREQDGACQETIGLFKAKRCLKGRWQEHTLFACDGATDRCPEGTTPQTCKLLGQLQRMSVVSEVGAAPPGISFSADVELGSGAHQDDNGISCTVASAKGVMATDTLPPHGAVKLVRAALTVVFPSRTAIPRHRSPQQGRLRLLCPLQVPNGSLSLLRVGDQLWVGRGGNVGIAFSEGDCFWFDESFDHTSIFEGSAPRVAFALDVLHPAFYHRRTDSGSPNLTPDLSPSPFSGYRFTQRLASRGKDWPPVERVAQVSRPSEGDWGRPPRSSRATLFWLFGDHADWTLPIVDGIDSLVKELALIQTCLERRLDLSGPADVLAQAWLQPFLAGWGRAVRGTLWTRSSVQSSDLGLLDGPLRFGDFLRWWARRTSDAGQASVQPTCPSARPSNVFRALRRFQRHLDTSARSLPELAARPMPAGEYWRGGAGAEGAAANVVVEDAVPPFAGKSFVELVRTEIRPAVVKIVVDAARLLNRSLSASWQKVGVATTADADATVWEAIDSAVWSLASLSHRYGCYLHTVAMVQRARERNALSSERPATIQFHVDLGERRWIVLESLLKAMGEAGRTRLRMAEIGVCEGGTSEYLLRALPELTWLGVDCYSACGGHCGESERLRAQQRISPFASRASLWIADASHVDARHAAADLDLLFVDASHTYEDALRDLRAWAPMVRPGGLVAGHDYMNPAQWSYGVMQAVNEMLPPGRTLHLAPDFVYWWRA